MKKSAASLFILFLILSISTSAQNITIYNYTDRTPVELVSVYSENMDFSEVSNALGKVSIDGLDENVVLNFQHPSFYQESLTVAELKEKNYKLYLVEKIVMIDEVVLSADKSAENKSEISNQLEVIYQSEIAFKNPQTSADMLSQSGHVFVQKSQMGGGSPILRGFEANKVLLVIDGVRMNNAIYRGGHLQNAITIDNQAIERTEVILGPGSLIYGSDALGGVMHFYTKKPILNQGEGIITKLNASTRFSSANLEKNGHIDLSLGGKKLGLFSSITFTDFDNLRSGSNRNPFHGDWGLSKYIVDEVDGSDTFYTNDNPQEQVETAYRQYDILEKLLYKPYEGLEFILNFQFSNSSDIPRYDRLNQVETVDIGGNDIERPVFARWDYGPQKRLLSSFVVDAKGNNSMYDHLNATLSFQDIDEERITRRFDDPEETRRSENVKIGGLNIDLKKKLESNVMYYGLEYTYNNVQSEAETINRESGAVTSASTRYPEDGSHTHSASVYFKNKTALNERIFISAGVRLNYYFLKSNFADVPITEIDLTEISFDNTAVTGSLDLIYMPKKNWRLNFLVSTGFRSPNVDDVGKIFDPAPFVVVVPNDKLKSEYVYNAEVGVSKRFDDKIEISATGYIMLVTDLIKRSPFVIDGEDSLVYDGVKSEVFANVNTNEAVIAGFSASLKADLHPMVAFESRFNYTYGQDVTNDMPLAHIPPVFGNSELIIHKGGFKSSANIIYHGWKKLDRYSPNSDDKIEQATEFGTPAWFIINFNASYQVNKFLRVQAGVENILDKHYRQFASGISGAGRNYVVSLRIQI